MPGLYIFGGDSTALEIYEAAVLCRDEWTLPPVYVVPKEESHDGVARIAIESLAEHSESTAYDTFILSMADSVLRKRCLEAASAVGLTPYSVIHPQSYVSTSATIGSGVYIAAFAVVSAKAFVADHVMINFQTVVGHHSKVNDHAILSPGAKLGGRTTIGTRSLIGAGAFVHQGKSVGDDVVVDALTYVYRDIESGYILSCRNKDGRPVRRPFIKKN